MLLRLSQYQFDVKYVSQKHVPLADCMSRPCSNNSKEDPPLDIQIAELYDGRDPRNVDWNTIQEQTMKDVKLVKLTMVVQNGWPELCKSLDVDLKSYWPHRHAISIIVGVIVLGNRIIIPAKLRNIVLAEMHDAKPNFMLANLCFGQESMLTLNSYANCVRHVDRTNRIHHLVPILV